MTWWRRRKREDDLDREIRDHLEMEAIELLQSGESRDDADRAARRLFGNTTLVKEDVRETWGRMWLDRFWQDLRYGVRGLYKSPVFTAVAMLSLAIGIGATVTVFSVFDAVFLNAVTARNVHQVKLVDIGGQRIPYLLYEEMSNTNAMLADLAAYDQTSFSIRSGEDLENITGDVVSGNFFRVLGVRTTIGRTFTEEEGRLEISLVS